MEGLANLFHGNWTNSDLKEIRSDVTQRVSIVNSSSHSDHVCVLKMKSPKVLSISVQSKNCEHLYSLDLQTRDLLVPIYKNASLLWLRLFFGKALEGLIHYSTKFMTIDEIKINSYFLRKTVEVSSSVKEIEAAAILFEVTCQQEEEPELDPTVPDSFNKDSLKLQEMLAQLEQENVRTRHQLQQSQQDIIRLKSEIDS